MIRVEIITPRGRVCDVNLKVEIYPCLEYNLKSRESLKAGAIRDILANVYSTLDAIPEDQYYETFITIPSRLNNFKNETDDTTEHATDEPE